MAKTLQDIVNNLSGIDDIFFFKLAESKDFCEDCYRLCWKIKK